MRLSQRVQTARAGLPAHPKQAQGRQLGLDSKDNKTKKQVPLRLSASLYADLAAWAEDEFRSVNGQIEYLLTECVKQRRKGKKEPPKQV